LLHGKLGPVIVPVNGGAVDERGVEATALPELAAHGTHGQNEVEVALHPADQVLVKLLRIFGHSVHESVCLDFHEHGLQLVEVEQVRNIAGSQQAVQGDVFSMYTQK